MNEERPDQPIWRIVDENFNRLSEGLRVLEDIARMVLNNTDNTQQIKTLRHELIRSDLPFNQRLLAARDAVTDIGANMEVPSGSQQRSLILLLVANARRAQEALRVLEEMAKLPGMPLESAKFRQARFSLYTIERELSGRLLRREKLDKLIGLYVIVDTGLLGTRDPLEFAGHAIQGGALTIQLRDKTTGKDELLALACQLKDLCTANNTLFIVNDHLDIALAADADGLHIGRHDLPAAAARRALPFDKILGVSAATLDEAMTAVAAGADYLGIGSIYPTATKPGVDLCGLDVLRQVKREINIPLVAIGGINISNAAAVRNAGAAAIAVVSAILYADDPRQAVRELIGAITA